MVVRLAIVAACALFAVEAWAINKCIGPDGKAVFQDRPCEGKGEKIDVRPASGASPVAKVGADGKRPMTEAERLEALTAESQKDRRRWDLREQMIPVALRDIATHKQQCQETQQRLADGQYQYRQNLYGKTHAAQIASEMAANAATCETKSRELKENLDSLQAECKAIGCVKQ